MKVSGFAIVLSVLFLIPCHFVSAQDSGLQAKIIETKTGAAVPFATVKVMKGRQIMGGVITNGDGGFQLPASYRTEMDSVVISCIGYKNRIIKMSDLVPGRLNIIRLSETKIQLQEVVITPKHQEKLTATKIIKYAILNLPHNYPSKPYSYLAYYRDYQKEGKDYVNLNEGVVRIYDRGFQTNDYDSTRIQLYHYRLNRDFRTDSAASLAYDNNSSGGNKFIPSATVGSFGGNELSILRIHDAIRNYDNKTYSYVDEFRYDFIKNHSFKLIETVYNNNVPLYHIHFESYYFVTRNTHRARGDIYIEHGNYAIHKLEYSNYLKEGNQETLIYNIQAEYARVDSLMYPNYLTVNNIFKSRSSEEFKAIDLGYDKSANAFVVVFNHVPQKESVLNKKNYKLTFGEKPVRIERIEIDGFNAREVHVFVENGNDFVLIDRASVLAKMLHITFQNIKDEKGNVINDVKYEVVDQFRELFLQKLDPPKSMTDTGSFIAKEMPLQKSKMETAVNAPVFWMNSPLKDNANWVQKNTEETLPSDSQPTATEQGTEPPASQNSVSFLEEKAYAQTDKPYYYPGEKIWYKVYMNYRTPTLRDSLSRVVHVELIRSNGTIEQSSLLRLENGAADGDFVLPISMQPGDLFLRVYSEWMLNFGDQDILIKPLKIFSLYDLPEVRSLDTTRGPTNSGLQLSTSKESFSPRELVTVDVSLHDADGKPGGNISVSVTDMSQVASVAQEKNIINNYPFGGHKISPPPDSLPYAMEGGITLRGKYKPKKTKSPKPKLMVIQTHNRKLDDSQLVDPDSTGKFITNGFQFYDSADIGFNVDGGKPHSGEIILDKQAVPLTSNLTSDLVIKTLSTTRSQRPELAEDFSTGAILLQEVEVNETKLKEKPSDPYYGNPDYSIPEDIVQRYNSIIIALQSKVPGIQISGNNISFSNSSLTSAEPLVILDEVRISSGGVTQLLNLDPQVIERIDVFKYGGSAIYGTAGANGVIIVHTKKPKYGDPAKPETIDLNSFQVFKVAGYSVAAPFKSPDYSVQQKIPKPDYRSTLLWQPQVALDPKEGTGKVVFYAADVPTRYRIVVEGVTSDLQPVRNVIFVEVRK